MVRAPCCEKMGLKKGPWTADEDQILVSYIQSFGHGNWRALPKQAGLLRCGKSCRLRWTNYLRPDIKRGNFTKEEEDSIISLHELLGNRWSAIAARLPGRTDNEIKNVWHTHLKKRVSPKPTCPEPTKEAAAAAAAVEPKHSQRRTDASPPSPHPSCSSSPPSSTTNANSSSSPAPSPSAAAAATTVTRETIHLACPPETFLEVADESFWSETLSDSSVDASMDYLIGPAGSLLSSGHVGDLATSASSREEDMDFWLRVLMEAEELPELPSLWN